MKKETCFKCKSNKPIVEFHKCKRNKTGLQSYCIECMRTVNRGYNKNPTPERRKKNRACQKRLKESGWIKRYFQRPEVKKRQAAKQREYARNPLLRMRHEARWQVSRKIKTGELVRPKTCSSCKERGDIQSHHPDYYKPLDILWLCRKCHQKITDALNYRGTNNANRPLHYPERAPARATGHDSRMDNL